MSEALTPRPGHVVEIPPPGYDCDFCGEPATWDIPTHHGSWANACDACEPLHHRCPGMTGVGIGQRLILRESPPAAPAGAFTPGASRQRFTTKNGWDVSIITHGYGTPKAPYELMATKNGETFGGDVQGWLTAEDVEQLVARIEEDGS